MLAPEDRTLLVDLVAPPSEEYRLEHAVATTFTLHLSALLSLPLALAGADLSSSADPLSVLQAVRAYSDRFDVFCQAGQISVPAEGNDLMAFLEPIVHQVRSPRGRLFHPKLWFLRFVDGRGGERFRLICGSRNLTNDRAWDVIVSLDGIRTKQRHAVNRPLADFLMSLPNRVTTPLPVPRTRAIEDLAEALRFVEWERPAHASDAKDWLTFHVFGPGRRTKPNLDGHRRLVVAPFLNEAGLKTVWPDGVGHCAVVSRAEALDAVWGKGRDWISSARSSLWVLDENAALPELESDEAGSRWSLSGLHAKLYIVEREREVHVFIGSANATGAAWHGNDEVLVEVVGRIKEYGVDAMLAAADGKGFGSILVPHLLGELSRVDPLDALRRQLESILRDIAALTYSVTVKTATAEAPVLWVQTAEDLVEFAAGSAGATLSVEPLTLVGRPHRPAAGRRLDHRWPLSGVEEITPFLVLRLSAVADGGPVEVSSIVLARLIGDPEDRLDRVLARHIATPQAFLRFLLLLLQLARQDGWIVDPGPLLGSGTRFQWRGIGAEGSGLLEAVLHALASAPGAIDDIDRLVTRLSATEDGRRLLPEDWNVFWPEVVKARSRLRGQHADTLR